MKDEKLGSQYFKQTNKKPQCSTTHNAISAPRDVFKTGTNASQNGIFSVPWGNFTGKNLINLDMRTYMCFVPGDFSARLAGRSDCKQYGESFALRARWRLFRIVAL